LQFDLTTCRCWWFGSRFAQQFWCFNFGDFCDFGYEIKEICS